GQTTAGSPACSTPSRSRGSTRAARTSGSQATALAAMTCWCWPRYSTGPIRGFATRCRRQPSRRERRGRMKSVHCWNDLEPFGILLLTGEACGLGYRLLCDVTSSGKRVLERCFGTPNLNLPESWNRGSAENPHVGCIMLAHEMLRALAVFALLESGCKEV